MGLQPVRLPDPYLPSRISRFLIGIASMLA